MRRHGPVTLVGHSPGGLAIGLAGNAIPDAIDRLVYVSAFCPTTASAPGAFALSRTPEAAQDVRLPDPDNTMYLGLDKVPPGIVRFNWRSADPVVLEEYRRHAMPEADLGQALTIINYAQQTDDAAQPTFADARVDADTWGGIPRNYIRSPTTTSSRPPYRRK